MILNWHSQIISLAPPEITVERSWVHAGEGYDIELACIVHGDVTSDVSSLHLPNYECTVLVVLCSCTVYKHKQYCSN